MKNVREEARKLQAGWRKYVEIFGEVPHGTENQLAALLTFAKLDDYEFSRERPTRLETPSTTIPSIANDPLIQVTRDRSCRLSELIDDENWGAHGDWAGQQALQRYREKGITGREDC